MATVLVAENGVAYEGPCESCGDFWESCDVEHLPCGHVWCHYCLRGTILQAEPGSWPGCCGVGFSKDATASVLDADEQHLWTMHMKGEKCPTCGFLSENEGMCSRTCGWCEEDVCYNCGKGRGLPEDSCTCGPDDFADDDDEEGYLLAGIPEFRGPAESDGEWVWGLEGGLWPWAVVEVFW